MFWSAERLRHSRNYKLLENEEGCTVCLFATCANAAGARGFSLGEMGPAPGSFESFRGHVEVNINNGSGFLRYDDGFLWFEIETLESYHRPPREIRPNNKPEVRFNSLKGNLFFPFSDPPLEDGERKHLQVKMSRGSGISAPHFEVLRFGIYLGSK